MAQKTGLPDDFLIIHLVVHRFAVYLIEIWLIDVALRSSNPSYTKSKYSSNIHHRHSHPVLKFTTLPIPLPTTPLVREPIDMSASKLNHNITWTLEDTAYHWIPRNKTERCAKSSYCFVNKLCNWCYGSGNRARLCAKARWNKGETKFAYNKFVIERESLVPDYIRNQKLIESK